MNFILPSCQCGAKSTLVMDSLKLHDTSCKYTSIETSDIVVFQIFQTNKFQYSFSPRLGQKQLPENTNFTEKE